MTFVKHVFNLLVSLKNGHVENVPHEMLSTSWCFIEATFLA